MGWIYDLSDLTLLVSLSIFFITISIIGVFIVKYTIPNELRYHDNPVVGNVSAIISVIYGVLVGLTALYLINNINSTTDAVQREANAVADLYRDIKWLQPPVQPKLKAEIATYLTNVIHGEWPQMEKELPVSTKGDLIIEDISDTLHDFKIYKTTDGIVLSNLLQDIKLLYDARQQRINDSSVDLNPEMWIVILIGTALMVAINYFFEMNIYMHLITISAVALMASSMIFLLVTLDKPFKGEFVVEPDAFQMVLNFINTDKDINHD